MKILLLGPTGDTGKKLLAQALAAGHHVRGAERDAPHDLSDDPAFEAAEADLLNPLDPALFDGIDAVASCVGLPRDPQTLMDPPPLFTEGMVNIVDGMRNSGVRRLVVISAAFVVDNPGIPSWFAAAILPLRRQFRQMAEMERVLRVTQDIDWTAVRPGWLLDKPATGDYALAADALPQYTLRTRQADLAAFMLRCIEEDSYIRERPFIARKEDAMDESPAALLEEVKKGFRA